MKAFIRKEFLEKDCVSTGSFRCDACPDVFYDENGTRKCEKEIYEKCKRIGKKKRTL
jgi:hypothetical protein